MSKAIPLWDLPLRLFKWAFVIAVTGSILSAQNGDMDRHAQLGFVAMALVIFRIIWGFVGSDTARFTQFVKGPGAVITFAKTGVWHGLGHNPLGALSILAILAVVAFKFATGIFANDDIFFDGPWAGWIGKETSDWLTGLHHDATNVLYALIALHLGAILWHSVKGDGLIGPMIGGIKQVSDPALSEAGEELRFVPAKKAALPFAIGIVLAGAAMRYWFL